MQRSCDNGRYFYVYIKPNGPVFQNRREDALQMKKSFHLRRITVSAVFLSISLVLKTMLSFYIPLLGQNGLRFDISGVFTVMPAILFGPVYGAVTAGLSDLLGYLLRPAGAYLPLMTLSVASGGFLAGLLWQVLKNRDGKKIRIAAAVFSVILLAFGILNAALLSADGVDASFYDHVAPGKADTSGMSFIGKMLIERTAGAKDPAASLSTYLVSVTTGLIASAAFVLVLLAADLLISKKFPRATGENRIVALLVAITLSGAVVSTLNTVILREMLYTSWKVLPFSVVWFPRIIEEILISAVKTYFVAFLLGVAKRQRSLKEIAG